MKLSMWFFVGALACLVRVVAIGADDAPKDFPKPTMPKGTPAEQVKALDQQHSEARKEFAKLADAAPTIEEKRKLAPLFPFPDYYAPLFLQIAEQNPRDPAAVDALLWIVQNLIPTRGRTDSPYAKARATLVREHLNHPKIGLFCLSLKSEAFDPEALGLLRRVSEKHPDKAAQAQAAYALARLLCRRAQWAVALTSRLDEARVAELTKQHGPEVIADLKRSDPEGQRKEAETLFERLVKVKELAAIEAPLGGRTFTLGDLAGRELTQIRDLQPGKPAPETAGEDLDGKPIKLSDYRGKAVVIVFWATWCVPCMKQVPHERELVERMKDRPFALVGVNGDGERDTGKKTTEAHKMTWRSIWNSGPEGPLTKAWNVHGWPTAYLIDHRGVIVRKIGLSKADDELLDQAVLAAEAALKK